MDRICIPPSTDELVEVSCSKRSNCVRADDDDPKKKKKKKKKAYQKCFKHFWLIK